MRPGAGARLAYSNQIRGSTTFEDYLEGFTDDESADYADETTVDRRGVDGSNKIVVRLAPELQTVVEAGVWQSLYSPWIARLRRAASNSSRMKWADVQAVVMEGRSSDAASIRDGMAAQGLVVTDAMPVVRLIDLHLHDQRRLAAPTTSVLFQKSASADSALKYTTDYSRFVREAVIEHTLGNSGLGVLAEHMARADAVEIDGNIKRRSHVYSSAIEFARASIGDSLNKATKLASKATLLATPIIDPNHPEHARLRHKLEPFFEGDHLWTVAERFVSQKALEIVGDRRLVVDRGHDDIIKTTSRLRELAEIHATPFWDRERGLDTLASAGTSGCSGFVRSGDDDVELRLQVADVVAGWARTIIVREGYRRLAETFACVLYNGVPLTVERAVTLDSEIAVHRRIVAGCASAGG